MQFAKTRPRDEFGRYINLHHVNTGDKFGRLTIIRESEPVKSKRRFLCKCDCGNFKIVRLEGLLRGKTKSCGCLRKETTIKSRLKHGQRHTRLYRIWCNMKNRCLNSNVPRFRIYGGRGISICKEWLEFDSFFKWAIENGYQDGLTIERKDTNGNYEPNNCIWVPASRQQCNKRTNHMVTYNGQTRCLKEWADELNLNYPMVLQRIIKLGWSVEKAFETPPGKQSKPRKGRS